MRILFRQFVHGQLPINAFSTPDDIVTRAAIKEDVYLDRLAHAFKDRVRAAAELNRPAVPIQEPRLSIDVNAPFDAGLLHVEKLVADALKDAGWLPGDRFRHLDSIKVIRKMDASCPEYVSVRVFGGRGRPREIAELETPIHEWRTPTPLVDYQLRSRWGSPDEYHQALRQSVGSIMVVDTEMRTFLEGVSRQEYASSWTDDLKLHIDFGIGPTNREFDLDNAALFVLDGIALWGVDQGFTEALALDRRARFVQVRGEYAAANSVSVRFGHRP